VLTHTFKLLDNPELEMLGHLQHLQIYEPIYRYLDLTLCPQIEPLAKPDAIHLTQLEQRSGYSRCRLPLLFGSLALFSRELSNHFGLSRPELLCEGLSQQHSNRFHRSRESRSCCACSPIPRPLDRHVDPLVTRALEQPDRAEWAIDQHPLTQAFRMRGAPPGSQPAR
jgi:hypothetical protein